MFFPRPVPPFPSWPPRYANFREYLKLPPWQPNWVLPPSYRSTHHLLHLYLPFIMQAMHVQGAPPGAVVQHLVYRSGDIEENGGFPGLDSVSLEAAYGEVLHLVERSGHARVVAANLQNLLSANMQDDMRYPAHRARRHDLRALRRFRAYAEVSKKTYSRAIASILFQFFRMYAEEIISTGFEAVVVWAHAVYRSYMHDEEKVACLRLLLRFYPDMLSELRDIPNRFVAELWQALASIGGDYYDVAPPISRYPPGIMDIGQQRRIGRRTFMDPGDEIAAIQDYNRRLLTSSRKGFGHPSRSPPPVRRRLMDPTDLTDDRDLMIRPGSAPGTRSIARQANRLIESANDTIAEAMKLRSLAADDGRSWLPTD